MIREGQYPKCVIRIRANAFANRVTVAHDVTCANRATGVILTVNRAAVAILVVHLAFALLTESAPVCPTSPVARVTSAVQDTGNTPNV